MLYINKMPNWEQPPPLKETNIYKAIKQELDNEFKTVIDNHTVDLITNGNSISEIIARIVSLEEKLSTLTS